jgi:hypothetical protein
MSRQNRYESQIARLYGYQRMASPLPQCVLVDRAGLIRATGLRGADLERAVAEVMAEGRQGRGGVSRSGD